MIEQYPGRWWHVLDDGRIQCDLCPRDCKLRDGQRGACFVRQREGDGIVLTTYGRSSGFCIDPMMTPISVKATTLYDALIANRRSDLRSNR